MKSIRTLAIILVVGLTELSTRGFAHASGSQFTIIDDPNAAPEVFEGYGTNANGINAQGEIVGIYFARMTRMYRGFLRSHG